VARDAWLNIVVSLSDLVPCVFRGASFRSLDSLSPRSSCRIRRVFTLWVAAPAVDEVGGGGEEGEGWDGGGKE
jgi:hypothetical protein